jgi:diphthine-ammonia ligase
MAGLNVVALISGGKDSFFSILHCHANGHQVVALANLHPPVQDGEQSEDIDSYMYQTVGHSVIPLYEQALGLPLYRQEILGAAVDQNKSYASPVAAAAAEISQDETESLLPLLRKVMAAHPEINAVSTGAILSDYQRTRVESVAIRLGLVPLSYLWQYPFLPPYTETSLLNDMASAGQDARIIKVASGGLDDGFLWENVANPHTKTRLVRAMQRFGVVGDGAAIGEGGEFETLAVDGPWPLWKYSIRIQDEDRLVVMGEAASASLMIKTTRLMPKEPSTAFSYEQLRKPTPLDDKFAELESRMDEVFEETSEATDETVNQTEPCNLPCTPTIQAKDTYKVISNVTAAGTTAGEQTTNIMATIVEKLNVKPSSIAFTTILLRNMSEFGAVNLAYGAHFTSPNPPARVTVACGHSLPPNIHVTISMVVLDDSTAALKQGLHVQSRSYWAPANIGPYSQAITMPVAAAATTRLAQIIHIAGQIPLDPPTMDFPNQGHSTSSQTHFKTQSILALQHLWRIGQITRVTHWLGAIAFVAQRSNVSATARVRCALQTWRLAHEITHDDTDEQDEDDDDDNFDVWDRVHGGRYGSMTSTATCTQRRDIGNTCTPPCFVAEVQSLPRDAPIEWASTGIKTSNSDKTLETRGMIYDARIAKKKKEKTKKKKKRKKRKKEKKKH